MTKSTTSKKSVASNRVFLVTQIFKELHISFIVRHYDTSKPQSIKNAGAGNHLEPAFNGRGAGRSNNLWDGSSRRGSDICIIFRPKLTQDRSPKVWPVVTNVDLRHRLLVTNVTSYLTLGNC